MEEKPRRNEEPLGGEKEEEAPVPSRGRRQPTQLELDLQRALHEVMERIREMEDESLRTQLEALVAKAHVEDIGAMEYILGDLVLRAVHERDPLQKILRVCEAFFLLGADTVGKFFTEQEIAKVARIYSIALSLANTVSTGHDENSHVSLTLPMPEDMIEEYLGFIDGDKNAHKFITYHVVKPGDDETEKKLGEIARKKGIHAYIKHRLFHGVTREAYNAFKTYFITWAMPFILQVLRRIISNLRQLRYVFEERRIVVEAGGGGGE